VGAENPIRYRGYYYDTETELYYCQSRYDNPEWGRWLNADEVFDEGSGLIGTNVFVYAANNPVNFSDSNGHLITPVNIIGGIIGAGAGVLIGVLLAKHFKLTGWKKALLIAGSATLLAVIGWFSGPVIYRAITAIIPMIQDAIDRGKLLLSRISTSVSRYLHLRPAACFVAGTLIFTENGYIPIEEIQPGDLVYSENPDTGEKALKSVVQTFVRETNDIVHLRVGDQNITTTPEHPFWVFQSGWRNAIDLQVGDKLVLQSGKIMLVALVQHELLDTPITVYNFEVEDFHCYYVSSVAVLVHNACKRDIQQITDIAKKFGINRWDFGDYVESYKISKGMRNGATLTWKELEKLAQVFKRK
jgi:RHS repeat-associated protein